MRWILLRRLRTYLLIGVVTLLPLVATWVTLNWFFWFMDRLVRDFLPRVVREAIPGGAGILLGVVVLLITGFAITHLGGKYVVQGVETLLHRTPIIKSFYGAARSITDALLGTSSNAFQQAALIEYPNEQTFTVAFITGHFGRSYCLFVPTTPNPTSGWYLVMPTHRVIPLIEVPVDEAVKLIISGGVIQVSAAGQAEMEAAMQLLERQRAVAAAALQSDETVKS